MKAIKRPLRIGIIGCGYMAQSAHLPCLSTIEDVELTGLYDPRRDVAEKVAARWGIGEVCDTIAALTEIVDAVLVLTPVQFHQSNIKAVLAAGKHVFTEKPLAMSAAAAEELACTAAAAGVSLQVGYMKQHEDNIRSLKQDYDFTAWGRLLFVRTHSFIGSGWNADVNRLYPVLSGATAAPDLSAAEAGPTWLKAERDAKFYSFDNPYYGLLDTGCHSINLLRHLTGKNLAVTAVRNRNGVRQVEFDMEGAPATMEFCVNFAMRRWDEVTELYFEKATVKVMTPPPLAVNTAATVEVYTETDRVANAAVMADTKHWAFHNQMRHFVDSLKAGTTVNNGLEAAEDIRVIEAIYQQENNR